MFHAHKNRHESNLFSFIQSATVKFLQTFSGGGINGGDFRHGTRGRKRHLHLEIVIDTAAWEDGNPRSLTPEIALFFFKFFVSLA